MQSKKLVTVGASIFLLTMLAVGTALMVSTVPVNAQSQTRQDQQLAQAQAPTDSTCLLCHNDPVVTSVFSTPHGMGSVAGSSSTQTCANCHGASDIHASTMQAPTIVFGGGGRFAASDVDAQNQQCMNCHQSAETVHWQTSAHQSANLACASCHTIHASPQTAALEQSNAGICLTCHLEQRSQLNRRSHHPVEEGLMGCTSCHNPHGSATVALLAKSSINETCTTCHTEKRGPFLWEHQPVNEDCSTCHNPHGSTQESLLSSRQPFLCQSCHSEAYHPSSLYSGTGIVPAGAQQNLLGTSCTNCHSTVHGSNHPSGSRLTR